MTTDHSLTRRDFLGASALGALGLWRGVTPDLPSVGPLLYVGTYTEGGRRDGIYLVRMNAQTGALARVAAVEAGPNPSFLAVNPAGSTLYAVNEVDELSGKPTGAVRAFGIDKASGALTLLDEQPSEGAAPCYVCTDRTGRFALVANYSGGTLSILPVGARGALLKASQVVQQVGTGPVADRQEKAHAHCVIPHPSNRFVMAADLGADRVFVYRLDDKRGTLRREETSDAVMPPGTGPRHLAFHPRLPLLFVSGELNSTVTVLRCDQHTGALASAQTISTLPSGWTGANFPADIHVAPSGRTLYVSNRGHNSVAVYSISQSGVLTLDQAISTGGDWPRNFSIDPSGRWLLAANQRSNSVVVFARDLATGRLAPTQQRLELPSPVCLRFLAQRGVAG